MNVIRNGAERGKKNGRQEEADPDLFSNGTRWRKVSVFKTSLAFEVLVDSISTFKSVVPSAFRITKMKVVD